MGFARSFRRRLKKNRLTTQKKRQVHLEPLEPRILLSSDPLSNAAAVAADLSLVDDGLQDFFGELQAALNAEVFDASAPLVGDQLASEAPGQFAAGVQSDLESVELEEDAKIQDVKDWLNDSIGDLIDGAVDVLGYDGAELIQFQLTLKHSMFFDDALAVDLALGEDAFMEVRLDNENMVDVQLDWTLDLTFGVEGIEFFVLTSSDQELAVELTATLNDDFNGKGPMGVFAAEMKAAENPSVFTGTYEVDIRDENTATPDNKLTKTEAASEFADMNLDADLTGTGKVFLDEDASFIPEFLGENGLSDAQRGLLFNVRVMSDVEISYHFLNADTHLPPGLFGDAPEIAFTNVQLDTNEYLGGFFAPVIKSMRPIIEPLKPVFDVLDAPIPGISDLSEAIGEGQITFMDIARLVIPGDARIALDTLSLMDKLINTELPEREPGGEQPPNIDLGSFKLVVSTPGSGDKDKKDSKTKETESKPKSDAKKNLEAESEVALELGGDLRLPLLEDPTNVFKLMRGESDVEMFGAGLDLKLACEFKLQLSIPKIPILNLNLKLAFGGELDLDIGYDTLGVRRMSEALDWSSYATLAASLQAGQSLLRQGFFFDDHLDPGAVDGDVAAPILSPSGVFLERTGLVNPPPKDGPEFKLFATLSLGASVGKDIKIAAAEAGVNFPFTLDILFDLNDLPDPIPVSELPDPPPTEYRDYFPENPADFTYDGRVRLHEMDLIFRANPPLGALSLFHTAGELSAAVEAFVKVAVGIKPIQMTLIDKTWTLAKITLLSYKFPILLSDEQILEGVVKDPPVIASQADDTGTIVLYMGPQTGMRQNTSPTGTGGDFEINEEFRITSKGFTDPDNPGNGETLEITYLGKFKQEVSNVRRVMAQGAEGEDVIEVDRSVAADVEFYGGSGNDRLVYRGKGNAVLFGDAGNDTLVGSSGNDLLVGGDDLDETAAGGNAGDYLDGKQGNDILIGDNGSFVNGQVILDASGSGPGSDVLLGDDGDDRLFGQRGQDKLTGGKGADEVIGGDGADDYFWDVGDGADAIIELAGEGETDQVAIGGSRQLVGGAENPNKSVEGDDQISVTGTDAGLVQVDTNDGSLSLDEIERINVAAGGGVDIVTLGSLTGTDVEHMAIDLSQIDQTGPSPGDTVVYQGSAIADMITVEGVFQTVPRTNLQDLSHSTVDQAVVQIIDATATDISILIINSDPGSDRLMIEGRADNDALSVSAGSDGIRVRDLIAVTLDGGDDDDTLRTVYGDTQAIGGPGFNTLTVDDDGAGSNRPLLTMDSSNLLVKRMDFVEDDHISYSGIDSFALNLGTPGTGNQLHVLNTIAGEVMITGSGGSDDLYIEAISGNMQVKLAASDRTAVNRVSLGRRDGSPVFINGDLDIFGSVGYDSLTVDSSKDTTDRPDVEVGRSALSGINLPAGGLIGYDADLDEIELLMGLGNDRVMIPELIRRVIVHGGAGADRVNATLRDKPTGGLNDPSIPTYAAGGSNDPAVETFDVEQVSFFNDANDQPTNWLLTSNELRSGIEGVFDPLAETPQFYNQLVLRTHDATLTTLNLADNAQDALLIWAIQTETHINLRGGNDTVNIGDPRDGAGRGLKDVRAPLWLDAGPGTDALVIDDTVNDVSGPPGTIIADRITGFTMGTGAFIGHNGFDELTMTLSQTDDRLNVADTVTPTTINMDPADTDGGADRVVIAGASAPTAVYLGAGDDEAIVHAAAAELRIDGGSAPIGDVIRFDIGTHTAPVADARLEEDAGLARLTALGPIADTIVANFERGVFNLGQNSDVLSLDIDTISDFTLEIGANRGDDTIVVNRISAATQVIGESGVDTVRVNIPGAPTAPQHANLIDDLRVQVEKIIVDNRTNPDPVDWKVAAGRLAGNGTDLIFMEGADEVRIMAGSEADSLTVEEQGGNVDATIDGDRVVLDAGQVVLEPAGFKRFDHFTNVIDFDELTAGDSSYPEDGFLIESSGAVLRDDTISPSAAASSANDQFKLTLDGNGGFALYSVELSTQTDMDPIKFIGTTLNGSRVSEEIDVAVGVGFQSYTFSTDFNALASVSWTPGVTLLVDNIVVSPVIAAAEAGTSILPVATPTATASVMTIDTNALTINGVGSGGEFNGTQFFAELIQNGTIAQFRFAGDLYIPDNTTVSAVGSRAVSLFAGNNADIGANVKFEFSAIGTTPGPGGGMGGTGGDGGAGGLGGNSMPQVGSGGPGGEGGASDVNYSYAGDTGTRGNPGQAGRSSSAGTEGDDGLPGEPGINAPGSGGGAGDAQPAVDGVSGGRAGYGGSPGYGGDPANYFGTPGSGSAGSGGDGIDSGNFYDVDGGRGHDGQMGEEGDGGMQGLNSSSGLIISGGGGGGGGAGGGGGSGGGGGGSGGGGGGGGGGGATEDIAWPFPIPQYLSGGDGGKGGFGGYGAWGGVGGEGGDGGAGGSGGGAFEILAMGRVNIDSGSQLNASGGDSEDAASNPNIIGKEGNEWPDTGDIQPGAGRPGIGTPGSYGVDGDPGAKGWYRQAGSGGKGGTGGTGGDGGLGGRGGDGGLGGGGAGGTVKLFGSVLNADGAEVDTSGGLGANKGGDGRLIIGSNTQGGRPSSTGTLEEDNIEWFGSRNANPFIYVANDTPLVETPMIADLLGGAEAYGLLDGDLDDFRENIRNGLIAAEQQEFDDLDPAAIAALVRMDVGPAAYSDDYTGFDLLLFINLTDIALADPMLGIDPNGQNTSFMESLLVGGFALDTLFDDPGDPQNGGPQNLEALEAFGVWGTLIPENGMTVNASVNSLTGDLSQPIRFTLTGERLRNGEIAFIEASRPSLGGEAELTGLQDIAASPGGGQIYGVNSGQDALVVINAGDLSQRQFFKDGFEGIDGLEGASAVVVSGDGLNVYVAGTEDGQIAVFERDPAWGNLSFVSSVGESSSKAVFESITINADGDRLFAAGADGIAAFARDSAGQLTQLGSAVEPGGTANFSDLAMSGNGAWIFAVSQSNDSLQVLNASDLTQHQLLSGASEGLDGASAADVSSDDEYVYVTGADGTSLSVFKRDSGSNTLVRIQTLVEGVAGVRGLAGANSVKVSADGKFVYVTAGSGDTLTVFERTPADGKLQFAEVLRGLPGLESPSSIVEGYNGIVYVGSETGIGISNGGLAAFTRAADPQVEDITSRVVVSFTGMEQLDVITGALGDTIRQINAAEVGTLTIDAGDGINTVDLLNVAGKTTVTTGLGDDQVAVRSDTPGVQVTISTDGGEDFVNLREAGPANQFTINTGSGADIVQVAGARLPQTQTPTVILDGGAESDTLHFDAAGQPIELLDAADQPIEDGEPAKPDGSIKVKGDDYGWLKYSSIESVPGFTAAIIDAGGPYQIAEGDGLTLNGSAVPATNTQIVAARWDLNGDGIFGDADGLTPSLSWNGLVQIGLDDGGLYDITLEVTDDQGISTTDTVLLTVSNTAPTLQVSGNSGTLVGDTHTIGFAAVDPGDDTVSEWNIDWGDGTVETFASDATAAGHVYLTTGDFIISVSAEDEDGLYGPVALAVEAGAPTPDAGGPYTIAEGDTLVLDADAPGTPSFAWDLDADGQFDDAVGLNPTLTWADLSVLGIDDNGSFEINVQATYDGQSAIGATTLEVVNSAPSATLVNSGPVNEGGTVTLSFTNQSDPSPADVAAGFSYSYDFDNDGVFEVFDGASSSAEVPGQFLTSSGLQLIRGQIVDKDGGARDVLTSVTVLDVPPTLTLDGADTVEEGGRYTLNLSADDPGNDIVSKWFINWGDGTQTTVESSEVSVEHVYRDDGDFQIDVRAIDDEGLHRASRQVTVENVAPTLMIAGLPSLDEGHSYTLFLDAADPGYDTLQEWTINWGDGNTDTLAGNSRSLRHTYADDGTFTITAFAADEDGSYAASRVALLDAPLVHFIGGSGSTGHFYRLTSQTFTRADAEAEAVGLGGHLVSITSQGEQDFIDLEYLDRGADNNGVWIGIEDQTLSGDNQPPFSTASWSTGDSVEFRKFADGEPNGSGRFAYTDFNVEDIGVWYDSGGQESRFGVIELDTLFGLPSVEANGLEILVANLAPTATLECAEQIDEGGVFTLTIGRPIDPGDDTVTEFTVDWGDGSAPESFEAPVADASDFLPALTASHVFNDGDLTRTISVTLVDEDGSHTLDEPYICLINNVAPVIEITGAAQVDEGSVYTLTLGEVSDPGDDTVTEYIVNWGDDTSNSFADPGEVTHVYQGAGPRDITMDLVDEDGFHAGAGARTVMVNDVPPVLALQGNPSVDEGSVYTLTIGELADPGAGPEGYTINEYVVDWGDGTVETFTSAGEIPHIYVDGDFTFEIQVDVHTEEGILENAGTMTVKANNVAPMVEPLTPYSLNESETLTIDGVFEDPGAFDAHTVQIDWGDGESDLLSLTTGERSFSGSHQYLDDNPTGTPFDKYVLTVTVTDDNDSGTVNTPVTVNNLAPKLGALVATDVAEGGTTTLSGTITDPGTQDAFTLEVNWGDGTPLETFTYAAGTATFSENHQYLDDDPSGTPADMYNIEVKLIDDDSGSDGNATALMVSNLAPVITELVSSAPTPGSSADEVTVSAKFTDAGILDTHSATINWGDGTFSDAVIDESNGAGTLTATHTYTGGGLFDVEVILTDDVGGTTSGSTTSMTSGAGIKDGVLYVVGTQGDDRVHISRWCKGLYIVHANFLPGRWHTQTFKADEFDSINIQLGDGNDHGHLLGRIDLPVLMDGGQGDDHLVAGSAPATLIGGEGDDRLTGSPADDTILGGDGNDLIFGGRGNDDISGGLGNDWIFGESGDDTLDGGDGDDHLFGGSGDDAILGGAGDDLASGDSGADWLEGGAGDDRLFGGLGDDWISGGDGNDLLVGGHGRDTLDGGEGNNRLIDWSGGFKKKGHHNDHCEAINPSSAWVKGFVGDLAVKENGHNPNGNIKIVLSEPADAKSHTGRHHRNR
jgi:6-phosphogluconolactonase (cycloisomerase 2 family)